jgi:peptide/nickel transport system substrate-binding protein
VDVTYATLTGRRSVRRTGVVGLGGHVRIRRKPVLVILGLCFGAAVSLAACGGDDPGAAPEEGGGGVDLDVVTEVDGPPQLGGTLRVGLNAETDGWNPVTNRWASSAYIVAGAIFDRLAAYDVEGRPRPYLAERLEPNADFTEWTIGLRPGVEFHDGSPLDAEAVKINIEAHKASLLTATALLPVETVEVVDPLTVRVAMNQPWATFDHTLTAQTGVIAAPSMLADPDGARNPVGTGPFAFEAWVPDSTLTTTANDRYWREGMPYLDGVEFRVLSDPSSRASGLRSDAVDLIETNDPASIISLSEEAGDGRFQVFTGDPADTSVSMVALNMAVPPFDDPLARRIVATGTDRQSSSEIGYLGLFPPAEGPFDRSSPYFAETDFPEFDLEEARRLNEEYTAEYGEGLSYSVHIPSTPEIRAITEASQERFRSIGVEMTIETMDQATLIADALNGNYEATGFILFGDPTLDRYYSFIAAPTVRPVGQLSLNFVRNTDPVLTAALDQSRQAPDEATRTEAYRVVQEQLAEELPYVYLVRQRYVIVTQPDVHGLADWAFPDGTPGRRTAAYLVTAGAWLSP